MANDSLRQKRIQKLKQFGSDWKRRAEPVLTKILADNPSVLEQLEYAVSSRLPAIGGSFYNPQTFEYKARKEGDVYFLDKYAEGVPYRRGTNPISLQRAAEDISGGLLTRNCGVHWQDIPRTARRYLIGQIKKLTGKDLRSEVKNGK